MWAGQMSAWVRNEPTLSKLLKDNPPKFANFTEAASMLSQRPRTLTVYFLNPSLNLGTKGPEHWILLVWRPSSWGASRRTRRRRVGGEILYFDPLGRSPTAYVAPKLKATWSRIRRQSNFIGNIGIRVEGLSSVTCGEFTLYVLFHLLVLSWSLSKTIAPFLKASNKAKNDAILAEFFYKKVGEFQALTHN